VVAVEVVLVLLVKACQEQHHHPIHRLQVMVAAEQHQQSLAFQQLMLVVAVVVSIMMDHLTILVLQELVVLAVAAMEITMAQAQLEPLTLVVGVVADQEQYHTQVVLVVLAALVL
jgi:hypothetical protein